MSLEINLFYKKSKFWEILHLYEHIIVQEMSFLLEEKGFFAGKDFLIIGTTWEAGYTEIKLLTYEKHDEVLKFFKEEIEKVDLNFEGDFRYIFTNQIIAEGNSYYYEDWNYGEIAKKLEQIHSEKWQVFELGKVPKQENTQNFYTERDSIMPKKNEILTVKIHTKSAEKRDFFGANLNLYMECFGFYNHYCKDFTNFEKRKFKLGAAMIAFDEIVRNLRDEFLPDFPEKIKKEFYRNVKIEIELGEEKSVFRTDDFLNL